MIAIEKNKPGLDLEFTVERRAARPVIVGGAPRRVEFPQRVAFLKSHRYPSSAAFRPFTEDGGEPYLWSWVIDGPDLLPGAPLLVSPFFNPDENMSHVYPNGAVCFGNGALSRHRDLVESFWGSNMRVLPRWLATARDRTNTWHAPVMRDRAMQTTLAHAFPYTVPVGEQAAAPLRAIRDLVSHYFGWPEWTNEQGRAAWGKQWVRVRAPWLKAPVETTVAEVHANLEMFG